MNKKKFRRSIIRKYKKRLRNNIINDIIRISCKDMDSYDIKMIPDRIFLPSISKSDSIINNGERDSLKFSLGYASVAINLLSICQFSNNNLIKDSYVLPALYCFRIYLENIIKESILLFKVNVDKKDLQQHDLVRLWNMLNRYIESDYVTRKVYNLLSEYNSYDPDSTAFRYCYAVNQELGENKGKILSSNISIDSLRTSMLFLYSFFEGVNELARLSKDNNN